MIVASWTAYGCYVTWTDTGDSRQWRVPLAIQIIPALILGSMIYLFPEVRIIQHIGLWFSETLTESIFAEPSLAM